MTAEFRTGMAGFRFRFSELELETKTLEAVAGGFLEQSTLWVLKRFLGDLRSIANTTGENAQTLELQSLNTIPSRDYEAGDRKGGQYIYAVISGIWNLRPLGPIPTPGRETEFCGIASTRIELYGGNNVRLGMWRMELGTEDSPGCYVHAQILGDSKKPPFPKILPIPRLPSVFVTPMSAIEFVLGELFQDEWAKKISSNNTNASHWRALQKKRIQSLLQWFQRSIDETSLSPWIALKQAKPQGTELL